MSPLQNEINHYLSKKTVYFKNFSQDLLNYLESLYPKQSIKAQWYVLKNNISEIPICEIADCNNHVKFNEKKNQFDLGCCKTHNQKITFKKNYGVDHPLKNSKQKIKLKKSVKAKYGVENVAQLSSTKDKIKETTFEKYGVNSIAELDSTKEKRESTMLEKYGVKHAQQNEDIRNKTKKHNLEKFGVEEPLSDKSFREKAYQTNKEKYGSIFPMKNKEILAKRLETIIERYDSYSPNGLKEHPEKYYQINKSILAENNNDVYYYFFDTEIKNKHNQIEWITKGIAETTIEEVNFTQISHSKRDKFIQENSLYMNDNNFRYSIGAYSNNILVAVFSGYEKDEFYEITRFVTKMGLEFSFNLIKEFISFIDKNKPIIITFDRRFTPINNTELKEIGFEFMGGTEPKKHENDQWDCGKLVYKLY